MKLGCAWKVGEPVAPVSFFFVLAELCTIFILLIMVFMRWKTSPGNTTYVRTLESWVKK